MADNVQYKMREIVKQIREALLADSGMGPTTALHAKIDQLTQAALELPLRQCDVGTVEEQKARFDMWCFHYHTGRCSHNCSALPAKTFKECALRWAQMPYGEGGAS